MKVYLLLLLLFSLSACTEYNGDKALQNYQQRLQRVLDVSQQNTALPDAPTLTAQRDLKQPMPDIRLDLTDAYATRRCSLDTLIGERNSSLGKVYSASKQLSYELRFLTQLQRCLEQSWDDTTLLNQLQQVYQQKQLSINIAFNNMLLTDETLRKELLGKRQALPLQAAPGFSETWQALTELSQLQQFIREQNWQAASQIDIEQQLQLLYRYNFIGRLQYSLRTAGHHLAQLNQLTTTVTPAVLCPQQRDTEQLRILANVFSKYFVSEIQLYTSELSRYQQQLWPLLHQLYQHTDVNSALTQRFEQTYLAMRTELSSHVTWWQTLNRQCPLKLTAQQ